VPDFAISSHKLAIIMVAVFVAFSSIILAIFVIKSSSDLDGTYLGGFGAAIVVVAAMIYYKVSGKPLQTSTK
jgi:hypothetical protein